MDDFAALLAWLTPERIARMDTLFDALATLITDLYPGQPPQFTLIPIVQPDGSFTYTVVVMTGDVQRISMEGGATATLRAVLGQLNEDLKSKEAADRQRYDAQVAAETAAHNARLQAMRDEEQRRRAAADARAARAAAALGS